jgi:hypothetical protein
MTTKRCSICNVRPVGAVPSVGDGPHARSMGYCTPCLTLAENENRHSDDGHSADAPVEGCWICFPELDATTLMPRAGSSRAGVVHSVPLRATGREKAKLVTEHLPESFATKVRTVKGVVTAKGASALGTAKGASALGTGLQLSWDVEGRFLEGSVRIDGAERRVRNVSEAYRLLNVPK